MKNFIWRSIIPHGERPFQALQCKIVFMVTISPAIFFTCYDFFICSKEVTVITIQQTFFLVCRRTNKYFVAV